MRGSGQLVSWVVLVLVVSGATFAGRPESAVAVGETCHGMAATIVGAPGQDLSATDGPDVLVTNGAVNVYAGAGNDLICVTGGAGLSDQDHMTVQAEDGDDAVDGTAVEVDYLFVDLGQGNDTFTGGPEADGVSANDPWDDSAPTARAAGNDTVVTGAGDDQVTTGGSRGFADHDRIDLGPGRDTAEVTGSIDPALPILGGEGSDELGFDRARRTTVSSSTTPPSSLPTPGAR